MCHLCLYCASPGCFKEKKKPTSHFPLQTHTDTLCSKCVVFPPVNSVTPAEHNSIKFQHYPPGVSSRSHMLRAQSYKTAPYLFRLQSKVQVVTWASDQPNQLQIRGSNDASSGLINLLEQFTELRKTFRSLDYKMIQLRNGQVKEIHKGK